MSIVFGLGSSDRSVPIHAFASSKVTRPDTVVALVILPGLLLHLGAGYMVARSLSLGLKWLFSRFAASRIGYNC